GRRAGGLSAHAERFRAIEAGGKIRQGSGRAQHGAQLEYRAEIAAAGGTSQLIVLLRRTNYRLHLIANYPLWLDTRRMGRICRLSIDTDWLRLTFPRDPAKGSGV